MNMDQAKQITVFLLRVVAGPLYPAGRKGFVIRISAPASGPRDSPGAPALTPQAEPRP